MDASLIPSGKYCYQIIKIKDGEVLSQEIEKFGLELREFRFHGNYKEVLCPYWQRTGYGTVRCNFLGREFIDHEDHKALEKIDTHFCQSDIRDKLEYSWELPDEIKICGVREDEEI